MKIISWALVMLLMAEIVGCGKDDKAEQPKTGLLKPQMETLENAKHLEQGVQETADQQRRQIEQETK
ncbi:MAG: hypothetical protein NTX38_08195 [Methylobacter sp.]|nr:hypothetical protein [Methylobacter sp.]